MPSRRKGRILAFQALYSWEAASPAGEGTPGPELEEKPGRLQELLEFPWLEAVPEPGIRDFSRRLIRGTIENINEVDAMIRSHLNNWDLSRLNRVDLAVLRISAYALMYPQDDVPPPIVIAEAIGICMEYSADDSFRFVNGVLDSIRRVVKDGPLPAALESAAGSGQE
jgi:N utilization substance protein B